MRSPLTTLESNVYVALAICLWFSLASTGYLLCLHRVLELAAETAGEFPLLAIGYLTQAGGICAYLVLARGNAASRSQRIVVCALISHVLALAIVVASNDFAWVLAVGCLANVLSGVFQGYYLMLLAARVEKASRGTVLGCSYAASTFLTLIMSLPGNGMLTANVPCFAVCLTLAAAQLYLLYRGKGAMASRGAPSQLRQRSLPIEGANGKLGNKGTLVLGAALLAACFVHAIGFSFPVGELESGVNLEVSRLLYGFGIAFVGVAADRDRRVAFFACAASLVAPFLMLALSGAGAANSLLWALGYLLTGSYVLFSALIVVDLAGDAGRFDQAGAGMFARYVGDAAGASLCFALADRSIALIAFASAAFPVAVVLFILLYPKVFAVPHDVVGDDQKRQIQLQRFSASHALTLRERDVLKLVLEGKSNAEIAAELVITERTVKFHMTNLLKKTCCKPRLDVIAQFATPDDR